MAGSDVPTDVQYAAIPGHVGYRVGTDGSVWSCWQKVGLGGRRGTKQVMGLEWRLLRPTLRGPYLSVSLRLHGGRGKDGARSVRVHTAVLTAFRGPRPHGMDGCHTDGNPLNCRLENLRWDTPTGNARDMVRHGRSNRGGRNPHAKITQDQALAILLRLRLGEDVASLAGEFGLSTTHVRAMQAGRFWGWLQAKLDAGQDCGSTTGCG